MFKEFMEFVEKNPFIKDGKAFEVNSAIDALPLSLGGNTYPSCQKNNRRVKVMAFLRALEELDYLRSLGREGRSSERFAFAPGQYEALVERLKKRETYETALERVRKEDGST